MAVEKLIEASELLTTDVVIACVFLAVIAIFLPHEIIWIFLYFFAYARMVLQKGLQFRMPLHVVLIVHERRIVTKLLGNFLVAVQKLIKARQFLACNVAVWRSSTLLRRGGRGLCIYARSDAQQRCHREDRHCVSYKQVPFLNHSTDLLCRLHPLVGGATAMPSKHKKTECPAQSVSYGDVSRRH